MAEDIFKGALPLGFGLMRLPTNDPNNDGDIDIPQVEKMVDLFMENGFTYFDTAWMYCAFKSEEAVKEAIVKRYDRDKFTLATKLHSGFISTEADCDKVFEEQRRKTGSEYFDYYLLHDVNSHSIETYDKLHVFDWALKKKEEGLIKHVGFSFHDSADLLDQVLADHPEMEFVQIQLNYLDYYNTGVQSKACYDVCEKYDKPVIVMEPIKGGTLVNLPQAGIDRLKELNSELSVASYAVRFAASHKNVKMVLSGMSNMAQMEDNISYMKDFKPLNDEELKAVNDVRDILNSAIAIQCTGCSYCTEGCPMKIAIPRYFALYNTELQNNPDGSKSWTPEAEYYMNATKKFGKASMCVECGQCETMCPQHLPIIDNLKKVVDRFE